MAVTGKRPLVYDEQSGKEEEVFFPADSILFNDGQSFQQKLDSGQLRGQDGANGSNNASDITMKGIEKIESNSTDSVEAEDTVAIAIAKLQARIDWITEHSMFFEEDESNS